MAGDGSSLLFQKERWKVKEGLETIRGWRQRQVRRRNTEEGFMVTNTLKLAVAKGYRQEVPTGSYCPTSLNEASFFFALRLRPAICG